MDTSARLGKRVAALVGVLAVAAALAAGHLVAGLVGPNASPFLAVGNTAIDLTPSWLKNFAVRTFGTYDKIVLLGGMGLTILVFAVVAGLLSRRSPVPGLVLAGALGLLGVAAVLNRPDLGMIAVLAPLASLVVGVVVFRFLHGAARDRATSDESRRSFLRLSGGIAIGAGVLGGFGQFLSGRVDVEGSRAAVGKLTPATPAPAVPRGAEFPGNPTFITQNRDFYRVDTALTVPRLRAEDWHLRIHGLVDTELNLDFGDIRGRPLVERTITMTCVSNEVGGPYVSTSNFIGVPLRDLLMEAGVKPSADQVYSSSVDGWTTGTPLDDIMDEKRGALLAIGMNGEPLPLEHGFPARMVVPGLYGYVSATKWVVDMELTRFGEKQFYWEERGWAARGPIKTQSRIDVPRGFANVPAGTVTIAGIAWAQTVGISKVEVRIDGGAWQEAELAVEVNDQTWRHWQTTFPLASGSHRAEVRATDRGGMTQTDVRVPPIPDGATGWHSTLFTVE
ncbi:molybdopterin-dependent oxidoreductase [Actinokineospora terrae]|uniref:DMSO/TMAO reductase YedYZ, molybdopterin-dependent catalytic subunit n=1 Tax=Actinokineospora terrae TaxID=155974 RepID=A0A1H9VQR1_9PSEU|nr:molybdopterin-dependent oxidoreductase [Actinokineospora terrae]SES23932.1 DMSO/TMAO reductase YedYZ, molybdopterin-dependent catalytic subunit [Actinokineospora terrae]